MTTPIGTLIDLEGHPTLLITREFASPPEDVWRTLTESDRLRGWIGHWEGHPASGRVTFFMTSEAEDPPGEEYTILECDRPHRLACDTSGASGAWHLWFDLAPRADGTTLTFGQRLNPEDDLGSIGPGWEYYLDRAQAVHEGRDAAAIAWSDYFPALQGEYQKLVAGG